MSTSISVPGVEGGDVPAGQIQGSHIAADAIVAGHIHADSIETAHLQADAVTMAKILDGAVTGHTADGASIYSKANASEEVVGSLTIAAPAGAVLVLAQVKNGNNEVYVARIRKGTVTGDEVGHGSFFSLGGNETTTLIGLDASPASSQTYVITCTGSTSAVISWSAIAISIRR